MKVSFYTIGCKVNQYETEAMEELFLKNGYDIVDSNEIADIYVINTCTVTNMGDRKSRQFINRAKRLNPKATIGVVGCYSQVAAEEVEEIPGVDVILGTNYRDEIVEVCEKSMELNIKINRVEDLKYHRDFENLNIESIKSKTRAYIKIQEGCNQFCSYCIIPYARGPIRSRDLDKILEEANKLGDAGYKEIILTGIHIASYGKDIGQVRLIDVIEKITEIHGIERIRLSSIEPTLIDREFLERAMKTNKLCHHFHLSLQSGSDTVLKRMNRRYTTEEYSNIVDLIREYMPDAGITTDIIVGFPGESEEEFLETLDFVNKIKFSKIHVFKYSPRRGTPASDFPNQVDGNIKNDRSERLIEEENKLSHNFNNRFIGRVLSVLFEEEIEDSGLYEGYSSNYLRVKVSSSEDVRGKIKNINILDYENNTLSGIIDLY